MNHLIWNLFLQTGNVETYLLLKKLENEQHEYHRETYNQEKDIASLESKV